MPSTRVQKPILMPIQVPWMVSPSTPFLRLVATECSSQGETHVDFVAYYHCEDVSVSSSSGVLVVQPPSTFQLANSSQKGPYRLLRFVFKSGIWSRMCPSHSDKEVIDESLFDWSQVTGSWTPGEDILKHLQQTRDSWQQSGICPDPSIYEVELSPWLDETGAAQDRYRKWRHYLILGHDSYIEVIAEGYEILEGQLLTGW